MLERAGVGATRKARKIAASLHGTTIDVDEEVPKAEPEPKVRRTAAKSQAGADRFSKLFVKALHVVFSIVASPPVSSCLRRLLQ